MSTQAAANMAAYIVFVLIVAMVAAVVRWCRAQSKPTTCNRGDDCPQCRRDRDEAIPRIAPAVMDDRPLSNEERVAWDDLRLRLHREPEEH